MNNHTKYSMTEHLRAVSSVSIVVDITIKKFERELILEEDGRHTGCRQNSYPRLPAVQTEAAHTHHKRCCLIFFFFKNLRD